MEKKMSIIEHLLKNRCRNITMTSENGKNHKMKINFELTKEEYDELSNELNNHDYLLKEYKEKIKLTLHEKCILESIDKKYQWIARVNNNDIYLFEDKPCSNGFVWKNGGININFRSFNHLFQFIKWEDEESYNIQELLDNCEVVEDE